jgi:hypothetical protein
MTLGVLTDEERHPQIGKVIKQALVPKRCALGARRLVATIFAGARITQSHREDGHSSFVIKDRAIKLQPVAQAITAGIIPRYPRFVNFAPRGLPDDQNPSAAR